MNPSKKPVKQPGKSKSGRRIGWQTSPITAILILVTVTFIVYARSLTLDFTKLDDSIFIVENAHYNTDTKNIGVSFQRGLFNPTKDAYYRPLFLVDFIIESKFFGTSPAGYHFTNLLFHIFSVILLYLFFRKIKIPPVDSLLLTLLFAVHPVLTQAVAWIPGRNDMLLMIFFLGSFILLLEYLDTKNPLWLPAHAILLLGALFTKETAVIIPVIMGGFILFYLKCRWQRLIAPVISWMAAILIWIVVRSSATLAKNWIAPAEMIQSALERTAVIIQYLGKIFFPVNLTVFPMAEDITLVWGFLALAGMIVLIILSKSYTRPLTWLGLFWFLVFLLPVLIVPKSLNDQVFEHRLYLPIIGILMILSQAIPFRAVENQNIKLYLSAGIILVFSVQSIIRTGYFKDPVTFWTHAVNGSPHSAYAKTLLATKIEEPVRREQLFMEAYRLDPNLKNLNYYIGKVLFDRNKPDSAYQFLQREVATNPIPDACFLMAQINFTRGQLDSAATNLQQVLDMDPLHPQANHNLALLYFQMKQPDKSREVIHNMQLKGMEVGNDLLQMINSK